MYHAIINNLTSVPTSNMRMLSTTIQPAQAATMHVRPPPPNRPPPCLTTIPNRRLPPTRPPPLILPMDDDIEDDDFNAEEEEEEEEEQFMQIDCPDHDLHIEINKTTDDIWNSLVININHRLNINNTTTFSLVLDDVLTFQDVYDSIIRSVPILAENKQFLKFKLKWHEETEATAYATARAHYISSKEFMKLPVNIIPLSCGEIIYKKIHQCHLCQTRSFEITQKCSGCKKVYYCSKSCQVINWSYHKFFCGDNAR